METFTLESELCTASAVPVDCTGLVDDAVIREYERAAAEERLEWERFDKLSFENHDRIVRLRSEIDDAREQWGVAYSRMKQLARQIEKASTVELSRRAQYKKEES